MHAAKVVSIALTASLGMFLAPGMAAAQVAPPAGINQSLRPRFSPYLNLARPDVGPVISYFGIVRPELNYNASIQQLQTQQSALATQDQAYSAANVLPATGHGAGFFTQSKYFMTKGGNAAGGGGAASPGAGGIRR